MRYVAAAFPILLALLLVLRVRRTERPSESLLAMVAVGGGVMGFMTDHVGFRGDLRYFRALGDPEEDNEFDIDLADFDYWRATAGVTFRW